MSVKEKEKLLQQKIVEDELETTSGHHTPEGLFTKSSKDIVDGLLKDANGDEELALKRITFYINRAGDGLSNKTAVHAAKRELEKKVEEKKEAEKNKLYNTLSEYFGEAYYTMFEDDEPKKEKKLPYYKAVDFLFDNGINPYWQISLPRKVLYFEPYDALMSLDAVYPDGSLGMLTWRNGQVEDNTARITPEEFKQALEDEHNAKVVNDFDRHYYDLDTIGQILTSGDELYKAWIDRFYNEYKDELDLKKPTDWKTHKAFKQFWNGLSNYEKSTYATNTPDPYNLATKDPRRGMPVGKIRFKASPQRLNGKVQNLNKDNIDQNFIDAHKDQTITSDEKLAHITPEEKTKYWLGKCDIDPKYANQPIKDSSGAEWKISKILETHNDIDPVRIQLSFSSNPDFKIIKKPYEVKDMITQYTEKEESIEEAYFNSRKMAQPTITDYNALYDFLDQNGVDPKFCRGAKLYGDLGQEWRITGYNLSDPENPLIAIQSYDKPLEDLDNTNKVMSNKVPLSVVQKWAQKQKNIDSEIDWDNIMLDPFLRQKAKAKLPDPDRKSPKIKNFDKVAARAKHGVM